jgi:hypothetical protein
MAIQQHVARIKRGVEVWNNWRKENSNIEPDLSRANLEDAELGGADLHKTLLQGTTLLGADLTKAELIGCNIHGISAWDVTLKGTIQRDLEVTKMGQPSVFVDNLEVAQFVYLLLYNEKLKSAIDTIGEKCVLIIWKYLTLTGTIWAQFLFQSIGFIMGSKYQKFQCFILSFRTIRAGNKFIITFFSAYIAIQIDDNKVSLNWTAIESSQFPF